MPSEYDWVILRDLTRRPKDSEPATNAYAAGMQGPHGSALSVAEIIMSPHAQMFRMKDADGQTYYYGLLCAKPPNGCTGFEPLDDFGRPNAGCTSIEYLDHIQTELEGKEVWEEL